MTNVFFINIDKIEKYGFVNTNIDPKKLRPLILRQQRLRIEPVLGTTLYDKIANDIPTVTGIYQTLLEDFVTPALIAYIDHAYTFVSTAQMSNKTTGRNNDEFISSNSDEQNNTLRDQLLQDAKQFERKLIGWLKDNFQDIPELCEVDETKLHQSIRPAKGREDYFGHIGII